MRSPVDSYDRVSSYHGEFTKGSRFGKHIGVDLVVGVGTPVKAPTSGVIRSVTTGVQGGLTIELGSDDGFYHRFLHLSQSKVKAGQKVAEGDVIALSGATGQVTGPHLHWDIRRPSPWNESFNNYIDPKYILEAPKPEEPVKHMETVKPTTWYVRTMPSVDAPKLRGAIVKGGESYETLVVKGGWRKITFKGKEGYVGPKAWS